MCSMWLVYNLSFSSDIDMQNSEPLGIQSHDLDGNCPCKLHIANHSISDHA